MKLSSIFKKGKTKTTNSIVETLGKNQLSKVIGGADEIILDEANRSVHTTVMGPAKGN